MIGAIVIVIFLSFSIGIIFGMIAQKIISKDE